ncbi:hypothetical protein HQ533_04335 [Candidatus Woesearchaeota archaeon]|nr:hypothetical protein [Candidatus Woesearchaeota archaeon]
MKLFIDLGTRNKGTFWEFVSAYSFKKTVLPITEYHISDFLGCGKGEPNKHCHHVKVIEDTKKLLIKEFKEEKYTEDFFKKLDSVYREPLEEIRKLSKEPFPETIPRMIERFNFIFKAMAESHKPMLLALKSMNVEDYFKKELKKVLKKNEKEKIIEIASMLLTPTKPSIIVQEREAIFQKKKPEELAEKYGWFHMEYMKEPWGEQEYIEEIKRLKGEKSAFQEMKAVKRKQERFFKTHPKSKKLKELCFALQEFSLILDYSKAAIIEGSYLAKPFYTEVAKRIGLSWRDMLYLVPPEITSLIEKNKKADKKVIARRKKHRAVLLKDNRIMVCDGNKAKRLGEELIKEDSESEEVKGIIAYPGKVKGKVTVIKSKEEENKFKEGDILVTHDGTAELTIFLKKASAIVTNQGGMICHAAIVAREMKTPCIVGTGNATKILKDGDTVEVDADKGVVKKVKSNKYYTVGIRNQPFLENYGLLDSYRQDIPGTKCKIRKTLMYAEGVPVRTCYEPDDRKAIKDLTLKELKKGKYTEKFFKNIDEYYKKVLRDIISFSKTDFSKSSNEELIKYFERYYKIYVTTFHPMVWAIYASDLQEVFEEELVRIIKTDDKEKIIEYSALLLTPNKLTTVQKEEQLLWEIEQRFNGSWDDVEIKKRLEELEREYGSFHQEYIETAWTIENYKKHILKRLKETISKESPKERARKLKQKQEAFFKRSPTSEFFKRMVFAMQEFLMVLDFSKADVVSGIYYGKPLIEEIGKRIGVENWVDSRYFIREEIISALRNKQKVDKSLIPERKECRAMLLEDDKITAYKGEEAKALGEKLLHKDTVKDVKELKGTLAYPGKVKGIVKIVTSLKDTYKFEEGNILVCTDTTTALTSIIKKSAAIVANQGFFLSHTAIVAREFKIPCIIQTKIGTKVFKDGDLVEVDADKGIIRKV